MLRLSLSPSPLETIPASPSPESFSHETAGFKPFAADNIERNVFTVKASSKRSLDLPSPTTPTFAIMSANTERRLKMERLRRKLGDDVPMNLVFPVVDIDDDISESSDSDYASSPAEPASPASDASSPTTSLPQEQHFPTSKHRRLAKKNRIHSTRDSIASITPHRAARKSAKSPRPTSPAAGPTFTLSDSPEPCLVTEMRNNHEKLSTIVESPNEYSSSEEKVETRSHSSAESIWFDDDEEDEHSIGMEESWDAESDEFDFQLQLWDIRRGYGGWTEDLAVNFRRSMSYRKPPPPY